MDSDLPGFENTPLLLPVLGQVIQLHHTQTSNGKNQHWPKPGAGDTYVHCTPISVKPCGAVKASSLFRIK